MMGNFTTWTQVARYMLVGALAFSVSACGEKEEEHTYQTGIQPTSGGEEVDSPGIDEAEAVDIAIRLAEQEGHDTHSYSDIVVDHADDGNWVVQLRRPRMLRFIEVIVDKSTGDGVLSVRSSGADG